MHIGALLAKVSLTGLLFSFPTSLENKLQNSQALKKFWACPLLMFAKYFWLSLVQGSINRSEASSKLASWTVSVNKRAQVAMQTVICFHKLHMNDSAWQNVVRILKLQEIAHFHPFKSFISDLDFICRGHKWKKCIGRCLFLVVWGLLFLHCNIHVRYSIPKQSYL